MPPFRLHAVHPTTGEPYPVDVPASGTVHVRAVPGATGVHIAIEDGERVVLRGEVACSPEDALRLDIAVEPGGGCSAACAGRDVFVLPVTAPEPRVARVPACAKALDMVFVVDATTRLCRVDPATNLWSLSTPLLSHGDEWGRHVAELVRVFELLAGRFSDARAAVVAFADGPIPQATARDLPPVGQTRILPGERRFEACSARSLVDMLVGVPACPGGDFVDALADALDVCASLHFRDHARKVVMITGDSPGYSLLHPPPPELQLDAHVREVDVDAAALRLFETWGAEVVTIYHDVPRESGYLELARTREPLAFARAQYARLASRPALGVKRSAFTPEAMAEALLASSYFGLGASLPAAGP